MTVFHGQQIIDQESDRLGSTGGWRFDFRGANQGQGHTARTVIRCPYDHTDTMDDLWGRSRVVTRMLAGHNIDDPANDIWPNHNPALGPFRRFVQTLFHDDYLSSPAFNVILAGQHRFNHHGEILPVGWPFHTFHTPSNRWPTAPNLTEAPCKLA
jgi:hypothetical protein